MKITATDLKGLELIDEIVPEPPGGAHADHETLFKSLDAVLERQLAELTAIEPATLRASRYQKFRQMGRAGREFLEQA